MTIFDSFHSSGCAEQGHPAERKKRAPADARRYAHLKMKIPSLIKILFCILLMLSCNHQVLAETSNEDLFPKLSTNNSRLIKQPNGPFAVMLFREYAQGLHIGLIYFDQMANPEDGKWWISERFWQSRVWGSSVTSIAWSPSGKYLYVGTSRVYGDGGVFRLNLREKTFLKIFPNDKQNIENLIETKIFEVNKHRKIFLITATSWPEKTEKTFELPFD